jgi:phosphonate transport system substrate-binding protein
MKTRLLTALMTLAVLTLAFAAGCSDSDDNDNSSSASGSDQASNRDDWPDTFRLGMFAQDDAEEVLRTSEPLKKMLETSLGMPVEIFTGTSYSAVIEAMRADRVDAMMVGPFSYILAVQEAQAEALAVGAGEGGDLTAYDPNVQPYYESVIFTKKGDGINTLNDLKGKGFNFVDPASTSGHLAPKTLLVNRGFDPDKDLQPVFAGSHPTSVLSVWEGKAPAGATNEGNLHQLDKEGQVNWCEYPDGKFDVKRSQEEIDAHFQSCPDGSIVILAQSDPIPNTPFAVRQNLPQNLKDTVRTALLNTANDPGFIQSYKQWFVDPTQQLRLQRLDQFYNPLRDIARLLNLDLKELAD